MEDGRQRSLEKIVLLSHLVGHCGRVTKEVAMHLQQKPEQYGRTNNRTCFPDSSSHLV